MPVKKCVFFDENGACELRCFGKGGQCRTKGRSGDAGERSCSYYSRKRTANDKREITPDMFKDRRLIKRSQIVKNPNNPRDFISNADREGMKSSMKKIGILQDLIVRPYGDTIDEFELAAGYTRFEITGDKDVKIEDIPILIMDLDDQEFYSVMFEENDKRKNLNPLQEAKGYLNLTNSGMTQQQIADRHSKSQPVVANALRLLKAPAELKNYLVQGKLSVKHILVLLPFTEYPIYRQMIKFLESNIEDGTLTVKKLQEDIKYMIEEDFQSLDIGKKSVLNIDDFPDFDIEGTVYESDVFNLHFDMAECNDGKCKTIFKIENVQGDQERFCYDKDCWRNRILIAIKEFNEKRREQIEKMKGDEFDKAPGTAIEKEEDAGETKEEEERTPEGVLEGAPEMPGDEEDVDEEDSLEVALRIVDTNKLGGASFKYMPERHNIDKTECNANCKDHALDQHNQEICTNPDCYSKKLNAIERNKKSKEKEEAEKVIMAVDHYLDNDIGETFMFLDNLPPDDPQIRILKLMQFHSLDHEHVESVKKGMRKWDPTLKDGYEGRALAKELSGADLIKSILRVQFFRAASLDLTAKKLKEIFPDAVKYFKEL